MLTCSMTLSMALESGVITGVTLDHSIFVEGCETYIDLAIHTEGTVNLDNVDMGIIGEW